MANVSHLFGSWVGPNGSYMAPGETHGWLAWGFGYGDTVAVSAHPVVGAPENRSLVVENISIEGDPGGRRIYFSVRNAGSTYIPGYGMGISWISQ